MVPILISLLLHGLFFGYLAQQAPHKPPSGSIEITDVVPAPTPKGLSKEARRDIAPKGEKDPCNESYGGLGVYYDGNQIIKTIPGYPGARLGLQPGDVILTEGDLRGKIGRAHDLYPITLSASFYP